MTKQLIPGLLVVLWVGLISIILTPDFIPESQWYTYRLASNLQSGHGLVFNPGDTHLPTITPLYAILLSLIPIETTVSTNWLNIILFGLSAILITRNSNGKTLISNQLHWS